MKKRRFIVLASLSLLSLSCLVWGGWVFVSASDKKQSAAAVYDSGSNLERLKEELEIARDLVKAMGSPGDESEKKLLAFRNELAECARRANETGERIQGKLLSEITPDDLPDSMPSHVRVLAEAALRADVPPARRKELLEHSWNLWKSALSDLRQCVASRLVPALPFQQFQHVENSSLPFAWMELSEESRFTAVSIVSRLNSCLRIFEYGMIVESDENVPQLISIFHQMEVYQRYLELLNELVTTPEPFVQLNGTLTPVSSEPLFENTISPELLVNELKQQVRSAYNFAEGGTYYQEGKGRELTPEEVKQLFDERLENLMQKMLIAYRAQLRFQYVYLNALTKKDSGFLKAEYARYDAVLQSLYRDDIRHLLKRSDWIAAGGLWPRVTDAALLPPMTEKLFNRCYKNHLDLVGTEQEGSLVLSVYKKALREVGDTYFSRQLMLYGGEEHFLLGDYVSRCFQEAEYAWECYIETYDELMVPPVWVWGSETGSAILMASMHFFSTHEKFYEEVFCIAKDKLEDVELGEEEADVSGAEDMEDGEDTENEES